MKRKILENLIQCYNPYKSTILAFSGGIDSVVLFYLLLAYIKVRPDFQFHLFHLVHNMPNNKEYSQQAKEFTINLAKEYNIQLHLFEINMEQEIKRSNYSSEDLARKNRKRYLQELVNDFDIESISMAHHSNDMVETILMRLFQGVSPSSFIPMQKYSSDHILRPLLDYSKEDLIALLEENQWQFIEDPSNQDIKYKRNAIRKELIPILNKFFPSYSRKLLSFSEKIEKQNKIIEKIIPVWKEKNSEFYIEISVLRGVEEYLCKESLKRAINRVHFSYLTQKKLDYLYGYIKNIPPYNGKKILFQNEYVQIVRYKELLICKKNTPG